jgi:hypothetical protein
MLSKCVRPTGARAKRLLLINFLLEYFSSAQPVDFRSRQLRSPELRSCCFQGWVGRNYVLLEHLPNAW